MKKKSTHPFGRFATKKSNAAIREAFRQEKRKEKKEREEFFRKKAPDHFQKPGSRSTEKAGPPALEAMPLNKFIAHCGVAARREAAEMVKKGIVKVNDRIVKEPGHRVTARDQVTVNGRRIFLSQQLVYILLNKPKDYLTTTDDPQGRKTVLDLVRRATTARVYPVGRLDRNTSGVLLLTNDGDLARKLTHPSQEIKKVYHVTLNRPLEKRDFDSILHGVQLEDGPAFTDALAYADTRDKTQIGIELHSGRNRVVRRIFEKLGYEVKNLDRVLFAGLSKKNVDRGKWRYLTEREIRELKHFTPPTKKTGK